MKENVYNTSKLAFHKNKLDALAEEKVTAPIYVRIKPTNLCDHKCSYCSYNPDNECPVSEITQLNPEILKAQIAREKMLEVLSDFNEMGVKAVTYSGGGEPLVYPHISEIMQKTLDYKIELSIITNGQKLNGKKAEILSESEWVRISASENNPGDFAETRKRPESWFWQLRDNIQNLAKIKKPGCELGINFVVHKGNAGKIYESVKYFQELGVEHIKITPCYTPDFLEYHKEIKKPALEQIAKAREDFTSENFTVYDTYENDFNLTGLSERKYSKCFVMQIIPVIGADSIVYLCHDKTYNSRGLLGSIREKSFKELWFSDETKDFFKDFNPKESCRHHCTYDSRNILAGMLIKEPNNLDEYKPESDKHKNFI